MLVLLLTLFLLAGIAAAAVILRNASPKPAALPVVPSDLLEKAPRQTNTGITSAKALPLPTEPSVPADVPNGVVRVRAASDGLPSEVRALGPAERLYRPWKLCRYIGLDTAAHVVFPDALMIARGDEYAIIPWHAVETVEDGTLMAGGETFVIPQLVIKRDSLIASIKSHVAEKLAPRSVEAVRDGGRAVFGPLAVDGEGILYRGKRAEWDRVLGVEVRGDVLYIQVRGMMMPWRCELAGVPNGFVYPEVVRRLCPRRLLEPA
jgi:hypothetical protein